jgi:hypothetical protein
MMVPRHENLIEGYAKECEERAQQIVMIALDLTLVDQSHRYVYVTKLSNPGLDIFRQREPARQRPRATCVAVQIFN